MSKRQQLLALIVSVLYGSVLTFAPPSIPLWARLIGWLVLIAFVIWFGLTYCEPFHRLQREKRARYPKSIIGLMIVGALVGAAAAPVIWLMLLPDEVAEAAAPVVKVPIENNILIPGNGPTPELPKDPSIDEQLMQFVDRLSLSIAPEIRAEAIAQYRSFLERKPKIERPKIPESAVRIYYGNAVTWAVQFPFTAIADGIEDMVVLERVGDNIAVSAKFFNKNGDIICILDRNEFYLNDDSVHRKKRTDSRLIVLDKQDRPVIDIEYINPTAIRFLGDFYFSEGRHIVMKEDKQQFTEGVWTEAMIHPPPKTPGVVGLWINPPSNATRKFAIGIDVRTPIKSADAH